MMIGTNDSGGTGVDPADFKDNVETIAGLIDGVYVKQVWLAELLPTDGDATRNDLIQQYNAEIRGIANTGGDDIFRGPDFYAAFDGMTNLYGSFLHPNDAGYQVMAIGWDASLP